jgi:hypothetical protein
MYYLELKSNKPETHMEMFIEHKSHLNDPIMNAEKMMGGTAEAQSNELTFVL